MCSGRDLARNVADASAMIRRAAADGAAYVQTPEVTTLMELDKALLFATAEEEAGNSALQAFVDLARDLRIYLHIGSMAVKAPGGKLANRAYVIGPGGEIIARYDKIHMFDVDLPNGESYRESANYAAGDQAIIAPLPWGGLGLTICYDLRFPALHRALAQAGARFIGVPAAFTATTGAAHWHALLRARAIETQCYVFAAAQGGRHEHGRETYGHSLIVSPWGEILADGGTEPGVVLATIDPAQIDAIRARVPSLNADRPFTVKAQPA
jgi:deaminated glutathione amidase